MRDALGIEQENCEEKTMSDQIQEAYQKFCGGEPLSDSELEALIKNLTALEEALLPFGPRFFLARKEISGNLRTCVGFRNARKDPRS